MHAGENAKLAFPYRFIQPWKCLPFLAALPTATGRGVRVRRPCQQSVIWFMLSLAACWFLGSVFIPSLKKYGWRITGQLFCEAEMVHLSTCSDLWMSTDPLRRGDTNRDPCRKETKTWKTTTQEALPCPSLWDTLQGEETGEEGRRQITDS